MRWTFAAGLILLFTGAAAAAPQSIGDCEKIADPDAYNRCLAAFGPAAHTHGSTPLAQAPTQTSSQGAAQGSGAQTSAVADEKPAIRSRGYRGRGRYGFRGSRGSRSAVRGHGRTRMTFSVGGGSRSGKRSYRRRR